MSALPPWPPELVAIRRTPELTETSMPAALRHAHTTKAGVWAAVTVLDGRLRFRDETLDTETELGPGIHSVIYPEHAHAVTPLGPVRFFVEFYAAPSVP